MKKAQATILLLATAATANSVMAAEPSTEKEYNPAPATATAVQEFKWGGDVRLRTVYFDNIPYANVAAESRGGVNSFQRYRTRIFGEYHPNQDLYFRGRLVNEFRTLQKPDDTKNGWSAFDETVIDHFFVDYKTDLFDIRVGRQDMIYGTGKIILDGTPKDGSRTIYFDAAKVTYKGIDNTTVDFIAMYTQAEDPFALHSQERDITGLGGGADPYDGAEAGGGIYIKHNAEKGIPWEAYWITKTKQQYLDDGDDINTVGTRLMPKWSEQFDANIEMAYQSSLDTSELMIDAIANWHIDGLKEQKACLGAGVYHLSEEWNPIFARWPQYSELYVYSFDTTGAGGWQNVTMPHIDFSISPCKSLKSDFLLGYMYAPTQNGLGEGKNRGLLFTWWNRFTLMENIYSDHDKLTGHLLLEIFEPGNYYSNDQQDHTASFARAELNYSF
jgi:hypothetical protein